MNLITEWIIEVCRNKLNCDYICANYCLTKDKKPIYDPYKIVPAGNKKLLLLVLQLPKPLQEHFYMRY